MILKVHLTVSHNALRSQCSKMSSAAA